MCIYIICIYTICHNGWCGHHIIILPSIMMLRSNSGGRLRWDIASIASTVRRMGKGRRVVFSRMRSKGSRFTLGVWGLRVCSLDVAFVVATVRNRSCEDRMAVPMGSSAEVVIFGGFRCVVASFRVAGVALRDIQTCSATCRKSFCVAGAILLWRFQKMCCSFRGRRSTLDASIVIFRGRRSTLDVSCCVCFVNRIGRAASSGDKVQIPWQAWHFLTCAENWRRPRTKHRFWGCKFSGSKGNW